MDIKKILDLLHKKKVEYGISKQKYIKAKHEIKKLNNKLLTIEKSQQFILLLGKKCQEDTKTYIESTVTYALQSVFGSEYSFQMKITEKLDQQEIKLFIVKDGILLEPKYNPIGRGVYDVCSFALRLVVWTLENSPPVILLDEPFQKLDKNRKPQLIKFIKEVVKMLSIQLIIITHDENLIECADQIIKIGD